MITARDATLALYGAYRLARFDPRGLDFQDATLAGFWRSFGAALLVAPLYGLVVAARLAVEGVAVHPLRLFAVEGISYAIAWLLFPVVMLSLSALLDRRARYLRYIVAYNWAAVLQNVLYLPVALISTLGLLPEGASALLGLVTIGAIMVYAWFVTRVALDVPPSTAAGLVVLDFLLSIVLTVFADGML